MSAAESLIYGCHHSSAKILDRRDIPRTLQIAIRGLISEASELALVHLLAVFAIAFAMIGMSVFMHEGGHGLLFRSRRLSTAVGFITCHPGDSRW